MRIIVNLNPISKRSMAIQTVTKKSNLRYEVHDASSKLNTHTQINRNSGQKSPSFVEIASETLANTTGKIVEKCLPKESLTESIDSKPQSDQYIDEEGEAMRTETTRFF